MRKGGQRKEREARERRGREQAGRSRSRHVITTFPRLPYLAYPTITSSRSCLASRLSRNKLMVVSVRVYDYGVGIQWIPRFGGRAFGSARSAALRAGAAAERESDGEDAPGAERLHASGKGAQQ